MKKYPIVYSDEYNIKIEGFEHFHPFDSAKYGEIFNMLNHEFALDYENYYEGYELTYDDLLNVHTSVYLDSLKNIRNIVRIAELESLGRFTSQYLDENLLRAMRYGTGGTVFGIELALIHGWAVNLSGGYHHAGPFDGEGFCFYADIPLAVKMNNLEDRKILIVDLDAHQGNGLAHSFASNDSVFIMDVYNSEIFPHDKSARKFIDYDHPVVSSISENHYLEIVSSGFEKAVEEIRPELVVFNAGTDIYKNDPLGKMNISMAGVLQRDRIIFEKCLKKKIPLLMVLSGGYCMESANIIGNSLIDIFREFKLIG